MPRQPIVDSESFQPDDSFPTSELVFEGSGQKRTVRVPGLGQVTDFMPSDDLNECVAALVFKKPALAQDTATFVRNEEPLLVKPSNKKSTKRPKTVGGKKHRLRKNEA